MLAICLAANHAFAQAPATELPGFAAYADPVEENVDINHNKGVIHWTGNSNTVNFYLCCHYWST